jgi:ferrous iron transport protein B
MSSGQQMEQSYIGRIGKYVEPIIRPCGFEWKEGVSIIAGIGAKEIVASTMGVLYGSDNDQAMLEEEEDTAQQTHISRIIAHSNLTPLAAFSFLIFILLYMPCIPTCISIRHESGQWHWAIFTIVYTTATAWIVSTLVYQVGTLFL